MLKFSEGSQRLWIFFGRNRWFWCDSFMSFNNSTLKLEQLSDVAAPLLPSMRCKPGSKLKDAPLFLDHMQLIQKVREFG